jgi:hypothetical protein
MEEGLRRMFVGGWTLKWFALVAPAGTNGTWTAY